MTKPGRGDYGPSARPTRPEKGHDYLTRSEKKGHDPMNRTQQLFPLGTTLATPGATHALAAAYGERAACLTAALLWRHAEGDWGQVCAQDAQANRDALRQGLRLLSAYTLPTGAKLWVLTEADRSATTILTPDEY